MESRLDRWLEELRGGRTDAAWDLFIDRHRRLIFSAIRHYASEPDDVMDVFAHVCEALHQDDLARLRRYTDAPSPEARFSTWLVAVVRNLTVDWFRHRDGRRRQSVPAALSPLQRRIFQHVFVDGDSHEECFQRLRLSEAEPISSHQFSEALTDTYRLVHAAGAEAGSLRGRAAPDTAGPVSPEQDSLAAAAVEHIGTLLAMLEPADRLAIQLFVVDELSAADVARIVGWPSAKMVYNRVSRGLATLRRELRRSGIEPGDL